MLNTAIMVQYTALFVKWTASRITISFALPMHFEATFDFSKKTFGVTFKKIKNSFNLYNLYKYLLTNDIVHVKMHLILF